MAKLFQIKEFAEFFVIKFYFRQSHVSLYLKADSDDESVDEVDPEKIGTHSCVTMFVKKLLSLVSLSLNIFPINL